MEFEFPGAETGLSRFLTHVVDSGLPETFNPTPAYYISTACRIYYHNLTKSTPFQNLLCCDSEFDEWKALVGPKWSRITDPALVKR